MSEDCLLAAKRVMYTVEYRRFYLRDLESVVVWPSRLWLWRLIIPAVVLAAVGALLRQFAASTAAAIFGGLSVAWVLLELALGPTARSRIRTTGTTVDLRLVGRTRRSRKVIARIDAAVRATRGAIEQPAAPATIDQPVEPSVPTRPETSTTAVIAAATDTNAS